MGIRKLLRRRPSRHNRILDRTAASAQQRADWLAAKREGLEQIFRDHDGRILHKWVHYLDNYDRFFSRYRGQPVRMLEIGVSQGGSLEMWRRYFGAEATIFGIDINPESTKCVDAPNQVRTGSQADPAFLKAVVAEMGAPDIILDDGSHISEHQQASFDTLFPLLKDGGLYVIEDLHTAYWHRFGGGYRARGTAIELAKRLVDDMHHWYHNKPVTGSSSIRGIHFFDSQVFIEKATPSPPMHLHVGREAAADGSFPENRELFPPM